MHCYLYNIRKIPPPNKVMSEQGSEESGGV